MQEEDSPDQSRAVGSVVVPAGTQTVPLVNVIPSTPPAIGTPSPNQQTFSELQQGHNRPSVELLSPTDVGTYNHHLPHAHDHAHDATSNDHHHQTAAEDSAPTTQYQILAALSIGAPLIASVVSSCTSVIAADLAAVLGNDPISRPAKASAVVTLLWCALATSLGSTLTAVAGLAMHAGYHDSHVGVTKRIVRFLRQLNDKRKAKASTGKGQGATLPTPNAGIHIDVRPISPALSAITDIHREQHMMASFRSAVVSARLLGLSIALLAIAIAVYLFLLYPISVAAVTLVVGVATAAAAVAPLLPILLPQS